jgi:quinol monooxygenase YgiN
VSITLIATIRAKAGKEKDVESVCRGFLAPTHKESGCLFYALHQSQSDPRSFIFIEKWRSQEDLSAHLNSSHITAGFKRKEELIERIDISPLIPLSGGDPRKETIA